MSAKPEFKLSPEHEAAVRALKIDDLTRRYIGLRDMKKAKEDALKAELVVLNAALEKIENLVHCWLKLYGLDSAPNEFGTPYLTTKTGASISDRAAFDTFVAQDFANRSAFFTNAVSKDVVKTYMEAHEGVPPPGVNWYSEQAVNFKR